MKLTEQEITEIAESLLLKYSVFIHKKNGRYFAIPFASSVSSIPHEVPKEGKPFDEKEYLRIDPPPANVYFSGTSHATFHAYIDLTRDEEIDLEIAVDAYRESGDENPFLRQLEKMGKVQQWLDFEKGYYEQFVQECVYPFSEEFISVQ